MFKALIAAHLGRDDFDIEVSVRSVSVLSDSHHSGPDQQECSIFQVHTLRRGPFGLFTEKDYELIAKFRTDPFASFVEADGGAGDRARQRAINQAVKKIRQNLVAK